MKLQLQQLSTAKASHRRAFLNFHYRLMRNEDSYVPPLRLLQNQLINPAKNPFMAKVAHKFYLAVSEGKVVGRFAIFGPNLWKDQPGAGSFGFIDFEEECGAAILALLEQEAKRQNLVSLYGPFNPNIHYDVGVQVRGFEQENYAMMNQNPAYYQRFFSQAGFEVQQAFNTWSLWKENYQPDLRMLKVANEASLRNGLKLRPARLKHFDQELRIFHQLYHRSFQSHWGFQAVSFEEFKFIAGDLKYLLRSKMALVAEIEQQPVGFVLAIPNINEMLRSSKGKITPAVLYHLIFKLKSLKTVRVMIMGVLPEFRHRGVHLSLFQKIAENIFEMGYQGGEIAWVMEGNRSVEKLLNLMGATKQKKYLLFSKNL